MHFLEGFKHVFYGHYSHISSSRLKDLLAHNIFSLDTVWNSIFLLIKPCSTTCFIRKRGKKEDKGHECLLLFLQVNSTARWKISSIQPHYKRVYCIVQQENHPSLSTCLSSLIFCDEHFQWNYKIFLELLYCHHRSLF